MKKLLASLTILVCLASASCVRDTFRNTAIGNFDALWTYMDERYCYFDYKGREYGLDWDEVYRKYRPMVTDTTTAEQLFDICCSMLSELRDGHVNLYAVYDVGRYWKWQEDYPVNFYEDIQNAYLGSTYKIGGGFRYTILEDSVGYAYYGDFSAQTSDVYIDRMLYYMKDCHGIIIDVRSNGGGLVTNVETIISHFTHERVLCGYIRHKTGRGHSDFSEYEERWVGPSDGIIWDKPVAVLTNRGCFSATNTFVSDISNLPQVKVFGDKTGGGGGMPMSFEMPIGWSVRYSSTPMYDAEKKDIEFGVEPDIRVGLDPKDPIRRVDSIIEYARTWLDSIKK